MANINDIDPTAFGHGKFLPYRWWGESEPVYKYRCELWLEGNAVAYDALTRMVIDAHRRRVLAQLKAKEK